MRQVSKSEFKARALELFRQVEVPGKSIIVTYQGRPDIEIRRFRADSRSPLERLRDSVIELDEPFKSVWEDN